MSLHSQVKTAVESWKKMAQASQQKQEAETDVRMKDYRAGKIEGWRWAIDELEVVLKVDSHLEHENSQKQKHEEMRVLRLIEALIAKGNFCLTSWDMRTVGELAALRCLDFTTAGQIFITDHGRATLEFYRRQEEKEKEVSVLSSSKPKAEGCRL